MLNRQYLLNGYYSWEIINQDGTVARKSKEKNNLILNQGLDYIASISFAECFAYCVIGLGTTPPLITDTGLLSEAKRSGTIHSATSFLSGQTYNIRRVFNFSEETETQYYGEVGWSPSASAGDNLFSKTLLVDENGNIGPIPVNRLQFLRVTYTLQITFNPGILTSYTPPIANWTANGAASSQYVGLVALNSSGGYTFADVAQNAAEPSNSNIDIFISTGRATPSGLGTGANYTISGFPQRANISSYQAGSYLKTFNVTFGRASGAGQISTIGCGLTGFSLTRPIYAHLMNSPQTKASDYELSVYFNYQWARA